MKQLFNKMSLSYKILTVIITLWLAILAFVFQPLPLATIVFIYAGYKTILHIRHKKYIRCIASVFLLLLGFVILDWGMYSSSDYSSSAKEPVAQEDSKDKNDKEETKDNEDDESDKKNSEEHNESKKDSDEKDEKPKKPVILPDYTVESIDDTSFSSAIRKTLNIVVTEEDYTLKQLYQIAKKEIKAYTKSHKVSAITAGFFTSADHIGKGYDMGRVEYVPNGNFSDAMNVTAGDYSSFEYVNYLEKAIEFPKGEELSDGTSDLDQIKRDFEDIYGDFDVTVSFNNGTLYVTVVEPQDHPLVPADENAITTYTDWALDNMKSDIKYLDITVERPSSSASALLDLDEMLTDNGRYFDTFYIYENLK